jgi:hypothetical protein
MSAEGGQRPDGYRYKVRTPEGSTATAGKGAAIEGAEEAFRFKVGPTGGSALRVAIALRRTQPESPFTDPKWVSPNDALHHGDDVVLQVSAPASFEGRAMRFVVEHELRGTWTELATLPAKVAGGKASATLRLHHPSHPKDRLPSAAELKEAKHARLRFHAELA